MSVSRERSSAAKTCPVCDVSMEGRDPYGHSMLHFSENPIANNPSTLKARQQQAELLGREIPQE